MARRTMSEAALIQLGHRLRALREDLSETQQEVADACGVSLRQYQRYEAGGQEPSPRTLRRIARHFDGPASGLKNESPPT